LTPEPEVESAVTKTCYACDQPATTDEHCPPKSFFPEGKRDQLITVGSCERHNNAQSKDVEYVRNTITTFWGVNEAGQKLFEKARRSFDRSPRLLGQTFNTMKTVLYEQQITGTFTVDTERFQTVLTACVRAIHFHDTGDKHPNWGIVMPGLKFDASLPSTAKENWDKLIGMLRTVQFVQKPAANSSVFQYGVAEIQGKHVYCLVFYESFMVYALRT
jgi:hypothetical protein